MSESATYLVRRAAASTVATLFEAHCRLSPDRIAVESFEAGARRTSTYRELEARAWKLASVLDGRGVARGARVALLSENRAEYLEVFLAAARLGAIVACQNWRLAASELAHCLDLVAPTCTIASPRHAERVAGRAPIVFGDDYERLLSSASPLDPRASRSGSDVDPEDPLLILYT